ncbi:MAG TPA: RcnB family protein [Caulobacteraceae bacterium]|jgi:Ni/Co efflux regulator RcnB
MKRLFLIAASALALTATGALAQDEHRDGDHHDSDRGGAEHQQAQQQHYQHMDRHGRWNKDERLPDQFHRSDYVVGDYSHYGWDRPPEGYAYYRTDTGDYVLAAIATGVIASVIVNSH